MAGTHTGGITDTVLIIEQLFNVSSLVPLRSQTTKKSYP